MIIQVLGWEFFDKQDADNKIALINREFGFPNDQTLNYTIYVVGSYNNEVIYYLLNDTTLYSILGEPYLFDLYSPL